MAVVALAATGPVSATDNLNRKWVSLPNGCYEHYVRFDYLSSVPGGAFRDRISNGRSLWNNVGRELYFAKQATDIRVWIAYEQPGWPNEGALALTNLNVFPWWQVENGTIQFNTIYPWHTALALPVAADKYDLYSVAGHEFGHLVALNHGTAPDIMRPVFGTGQNVRALSAHDKDGIKFYYAALVC